MSRTPAQIIELVCTGCGVKFIRKKRIHRRRLKDNPAQLLSFCNYSCWVNYKTGGREARERFWDNVDKSPGRGPKGECWVWTAGKKKKGYGIFRADGKDCLAHRLAFVIEHGINLADIVGLVVRHSCDNPPCCNSDHLDIGNQQDNVDDMMERARKVTIKGEKSHFCTKLNEAKVLEIRQLLAIGTTQQVIADQFGINQTSVSHIKFQRSWKHLPEKPQSLAENLRE